jgi:hypothetical protein
MPMAVGRQIPPLAPNFSGYFHFYLLVQFGNSLEINNLKASAKERAIAIGTLFATLSELTI